MTVHSSRPECQAGDRESIRGRLDQRTERLLRPVEPPRATLRVVQCETGAVVVIKDFGHTGWLYRHTVGRFLIRREAKAYRRLQGVPGIPRIFPSPDPDLLVLEYIPGVELSHVALGKLPPEALDQLCETLEAMHRRGVAHLDLGHDSHGRLGRSTNLIWSDEGRLYVVDLAGALFRPEGPALLRRLFHEVCAHDLLALEKVRRLFFPGSPGREAVRLVPWVEWIMKFFRKL